MKKNLALLISVITFVCLFYHQDVGVNLTLFAILVWGYVSLLKNKNFTGNIYWLHSATVWLSAAAFAWYGDFICLCATYASIMVFSLKAFNTRINILQLPVLVFFNYLFFPIRALNIPGWLPLPKDNTNIVLKKIFAYALIPLGLIAIFAGLYSVVSDQFASMLTINWNMDVLQIVVLTCLGFFLSFTIYHFFSPRFLLKLNPILQENYASGNSVPNQFFKPILDPHFLRKSGEISFICLNLLLLVFIGFYINEQFGAAAISGTLSEAVHERIYVLIFSIAVAIVIIMSYFRKQFSLDAKAKFLKQLAITWIILNSVIIIIAALVNQHYVAAYGLTFKRIGVYIFLLMSMIGLAFTILKLVYKKTNWYLINRMIWSFYTLLILSAVINWSNVVTRFNINNQKNIDWYYLNQLSFNKAILQEYNQLTPQESNTIDDRKRDHWLSKNLYYHFLKTNTP